MWNYKMSHILKTAGRREKRAKIWASGASSYVFKGYF